MCKFTEKADAAFQAACYEGQLGIVRKLLALSGDRRVDVHAQLEWAYHMACEYGRLDVVRELLALTGQRTVPAGARAQCTPQSLHAEAGPS